MLRGRQGRGWARRVRGPLLDGMASSRHAGHAGPCLFGRCASARHQGERTSTSRQTCCPSRFPRCAGSSGTWSGPSRPTPSALLPGRTGGDDTSSAPDDHTGRAEPELINPGCSTSLVLILVASEIGRGLGVRAGGRGGENASTLESAILGLLALMIGFTFAMALSRFEARREAVLNEANAIGTTALRARLLPAPHNAAALNVLREYVQLRLDITRRVPSSTELNAATARSNGLQEALWQQAMAVAAKDSGLVPTGLFIQALNEMIDSQGKRLAAFHSRVPNIVLLALYGVATVA